MLYYIVLLCPAHQKCRGFPVVGAENVGHGGACGPPFALAWRVCQQGCQEFDDVYIQERQPRKGRRASCVHCHSKHIVHGDVIFQSLFTPSLAFLFLFLLFLISRL